MDSLPAPLYIQCLLYIIGNLYNDNDEPIPGLGLLPRQLRIKLLLLLPPIDVCKLEGTSVTRDISMNDEIWERISERIFKVTYRNHKYLADMVLYFDNKKYPWRDLCFTTMLHDYSSTPKKFFEISDMNLHMYFAQMKAHIIHGVIMNSRSQLITRKIEGMMDEKIFLDIGTTMASHRKIPLKYLELPSIVRRVPFYFFCDTKITLSVEAITMRNHYCADFIKQCFHIVFIENQCHIKFIRIYEDNLDLIMPYLLQQCHLRKLELMYCTEQHIAKHSSELRELLKRHNHIEEVLLDCRWIEDYNFLQCFSELMSESAALQKLTLSCHGHASFEVLQTFLAQFFLSPYPVDLSLSIDTSLINFDPLPEPLPINFEQQSKSLSLYAIGDVPPNLSSLLPQHIVLQSLTINHETISSFAKLKSIKVHKICVVMDVLIDSINALSSLVNIVSAKEWDLTACEYDQRWPLLNRFTEALAMIATNLQQFHVNFFTWGDAENILHKVFSSYFELICDTDTGYTDHYSNTDTNTISVYNGTKGFKLWTVSL